AACMSGRTAEDQKTCLREAGAAAQAARQGGLAHEEENYRQNALARCLPLPPEQREACRMRIQGEGTVRGSVEGGGLYRELRIREPAPQATTPAPSTTIVPPSATTPPAVVVPSPGTPAAGPAPASPAAAPSAAPAAAP